MTAIFADDETSTGERRRLADLQTVGAASSAAASRTADLRVAAVAAPAAVSAAAPAEASRASGWKYCIRESELYGADVSGELYPADEDQDGQGGGKPESEGGWNLQVRLR